VLDADEVARIARVKPRGMGVRGSRDQQIHPTSSRLPARNRNRNRSSKLAVAGGHRIVDGQRREPALKARQPAQAVSTDCWIGGHKHTEVQFGESGG